ncbi:MAG: helix-hairpin-helix domain-containing protein [bacterium]
MIGKRRKNLRASALIIVMIMTLGLVAVILIFVHSVRLEYRAAGNSQAALEADQAIQGMERYVSWILTDIVTPGEMPDGEEYDFTAMQAGDATIWLIGRDDDESAESPVFGLVDEASKLNLNTASLEMLQALPNMDADVAAAIVDWRDTDSELTEGGAEAQDYLLLDPAYNCKDGPFETVEELRLVMGVDIERLYGEDTNRNGILDPNEDDGDLSKPADNQDGKLDCGLLEYVTIYTREPNTNTDGEKRVNITDEDSRQQLRERLEEKLDSSRVGEILSRAGNTEEMKSVLEFYLRGDMKLEECAQLDAELSVSDDAFLPGLVNINTASRDVLAALPGIGEANADNVVAWRENRTDSELATVRWLAEVIDRDAAIEAGPWITTRSYQFMADIAACGSNGKGFRRSQFIFDCAEMQADDSEDDSESARPLVVFRGEVSRLGWPLGLEIRNDLAQAITEGE